MIRPDVSYTTVVLPESAEVTVNGRPEPSNVADDGVAVREFATTLLPAKSYCAPETKPFGSVAFNKRPPLSNSNLATANVTVSVTVVTSRSTAVVSYANVTGDPADDDCEVTRFDVSHPFNINTTPVASANLSSRPDTPDVTVCTKRPSIVTVANAFAAFNP